MTWRGIMKFQILGLTLFSIRYVFFECLTIKDKRNKSCLGGPMSFYIGSRGAGFP